MGQIQRQAALQSRYDCIHASLFGEFKLIKADATEILISNRRAKALLALLCLNGDKAIDREQLSKLLWPGRLKAMPGQACGNAYSILANCSNRLERSCCK